MARPVSVNTAAARANSGVQAGLVAGALEFQP
jgi:hypothetical protein